MHDALSTRTQSGVRRRARTSVLIAIAVVAASILLLVGLASLLLRSQIDPHIENYPLHFVVFGIVGAVAFGLGYASGEAANRRGGRASYFFSLAFMATGGFLWLHAIGTPTILFSKEHAGFQVAIPIGLLLSAVFALGSAFVDVLTGPPPRSCAGRRSFVSASGMMVGWFAWTRGRPSSRRRDGE